MSYIPSAQSAGGAEKYHGAVAQGYDAKRKDSVKWLIEQRAIEAMLADLRPGEWVLDCPVGTGRFFDTYKDKRVCVRGFDLSMDMLKQAEQKAFQIDFGVQKLRLQQGDIRSLPLEDKSCDVSVMCRLTRWLSAEDCQQAMRELQRVTRRRIVFTARVRNHPEARPLSLFESVLSGWRIAENAEGYHPDYRIVSVEPV